MERTPFRYLLCKLNPVISFERVSQSGADPPFDRQVAMELGDDRLVRILVLAMQKKKPRFMSVDDVANKAKTDER